MSADVTRSRLAVLLFSDIVGSTDLKSQLGAISYTRSLERHNRLFESLCAQFENSEIFKHTGDGYFAAFTTATDAVNFALRFQHALRSEAWNGTPLTTRVGIHIGEVAVVQMAGKADVVGLAADLAARVMSLAQGGQILLTREAFNNARQFVSDPSLRWLAHGPYQFKGSDEPLDVFEVGVENVAPLSPPQDVEKARRVVPHDQEQTLGWRPAVGLDVPNRVGWKLQRKLGEGGFGEVWLAQHARTRDRRVFKFCFDSERLRSFKRELTLFRLLRDVLGDRDDIAKLYDVKLDEPPFFLESEYTEGGSLVEWVGQQRGLARVPLKQRIETVAKVADAVAAAHSVGILHKDIKPANILIHVDRSGVVHPRLGDFGIGMLRDRRELQQRGITASGLTLITEMESGTSGTPLYSPPELLAGYPFSMQGDIYALGVVLYQMVIADLDRPLAQGWERDVTDELLREDIAVCVDGDPQRRLASASALAQRLRGLDDRRVQVERERNIVAETARRARLVRVSVSAAVGLAMLLTVCAIGAAIYISQIKAEQARTMAQKQEAEVQRAQSERRRKEAENAEAAMQAANRFLNDLLASADPFSLSPTDPARGRDVTVLAALNAAADKVEAGDLKATPEVEAAVRLTIGQTYQALGENSRAQPHLRRALELYQREHGECDHVASCLDQLGLSLREANDLTESEKMHRHGLDLRRKLHGDEHATVATSLNNLALVLQAQQKFDEAEKLLRESLALNRRLLGEQNPEFATSLNNLAMLLQTTGKLDEAESLHRQALALRRSALGEEHPLVALSMDNLASCFQDQGKHSEADRLYREALTIRRARLGPAHPELSNTLNNLASLLLAQGKFTEAESLCREAVAMDRQLFQPNDPRLAISLRNLGLALQEQGRFSEAEPLALEVLEIERQAFGKQSRQAAVSMNNLGAVFYRQQKLSEAESIWKEALAVRRQLLPADHPDLAQSLNNLARVMVEERKYAAAEPLAREAMEIRRKSLPPDDWLQGASSSLLGHILAAQNRFDEAEPLLLAGYQGMKDKPKAPISRRRESIQRLISLYDSWNKPAQAAHWRSQLAALDGSTRPATAPATAPAG